MIHLESIQSLPKRIDLLDSLVDKFIVPSPENPSVASVDEREELSSIFLEVWTVRFGYLTEVWDCDALNVRTNMACAVLVGTLSYLNLWSWPDMLGNAFSYIYHVLLAQGCCLYIPRWHTTIFLIPEFPLFDANWLNGNNWTSWTYFIKLVTHPWTSIPVRYQYALGLKLAYIFRYFSKFCYTVKIRQLVKMGNFFCSNSTFRKGHCCRTSKKEKKATIFGM